MPAAARTNINLKGNEIVVSIKKPGGTDYILFGCATDINYDSAGAEVDELACRAGTTKSPSSDVALPTFTIENLIRIYPTGDVATNISDAEILSWVESPPEAGVDTKISFGTKAGDIVKSGPVHYNGYSAKGPQKGSATGSVTGNFLSMPTSTALV